PARREALVLEPVVAVDDARLFVEGGHERPVPALRSEAVVVADHPDDRGEAEELRVTASPTKRGTHVARGLDDVDVALGVLPDGRVVSVEDEHQATARIRPRLLERGEAFGCLARPLAGGAQGEDAHAASMSINSSSSRCRSSSTWSPIPEPSRTRTSDRCPRPSPP